MKHLFNSLLLIIGLGFTNCDNDSAEAPIVFPDKIGTRWLYENSIRQDTIEWEIVGNEIVNNNSCIVIRTHLLKSNVYNYKYYNVNSDGVTLVAEKLPKASNNTNDSTNENYALYIYKNTNYLFKSPKVIGDSWDHYTATFATIDLFHLEIIEIKTKKTYINQERISLPIGQFDCYIVNCEEYSSQEYYSDQGLILARSKFVIGQDTINVEERLIDFKN